MNIKTFPIVMDMEFHKKLVEAAAKNNKPIKQFIIDILVDKIKEIENK